jgi:hypothetical protein
MMADNFQSSSDTISGPARKVFAITPHASNEINPLPKSVRFNVGGTVAFRAVDSTEDVSVTVADGEQLDYRMQYIRATGTTATGILGAA